MSHHPERWETGGGQQQRDLPITLKVGFDSEIYGEPLEDFKLRGEGKPQILQSLPKQHLWSRDWKGHRQKQKILTNLFQACHGLRSLPRGRCAAVTAVRPPRSSGSAPGILFLSSPCRSRPPCESPKKACFLGKIWVLVSLRCLDCALTLDREDCPQHFCGHCSLVPWRCQSGSLSCDLTFERMIACFSLSWTFYFSLTSLPVRCLEHIKLWPTYWLVSSSGNFFFPSSTLIVSLLRSELKCQLWEGFPYQPS